MPKWNAVDYSQNSSEQQRWGQELIDKLNLEGSERVLDIGCGHGKLTAAIAKRLPNGSILGIDNSSEMVKFARSGFPASQYPNLSFKLLDARDLDFREEFDVIFSNAVLHWVLDHQPVLNGIYQSLKPNGRILLQMGGKGNAGEMVTVIHAMIEQEKWSAYFTRFTFPYGFYGTEEYQDWLTQAGFQVEYVNLIPKDMVHKGKDGLCGWIRTTWLPYLERIPQDLREDFIDEAADAYIKNHPVNNNGDVHLTMMRLEVRAKKTG